MNNRRNATETSTPPETVLERVKSHSWEIVNHSSNVPDCTRTDGTSIPFTALPNLKNRHISVDDSDVTNSYLESTNDYECVVPERIDHYLELHQGGSLVRIKPTEVNPLKDYWETGDQIRGVRKEITRFTTKSRKNLLEKLCSINQDKIPSNSILFTTLTIDGRDTPTDCKKYLNNFLTQLRQRYEGHKWFYCWKAEFQKRGVLHFHIVTFGLKSISHKWLRHTWSRISLGFKEYKRRCDIADNDKELFKSLVVTDIEHSRGWGNTQRYFSKTLGYVSKHGTEEEQLIEKFNKGDRVGRFWSIGRSEVYRNYVNTVAYKLTEPEWGTLRRTCIYYLKSTWIRKGNMDWVKWKRFERYLKTGYRKFKHRTQTIEVWKLEPEVTLFIGNRNVKRLLRCLLPDKEEIFPDKPLDAQLSFVEWVREKERQVVPHQLRHVGLDMITV